MAWFNNKYFRFGADSTSFGSKNTLTEYSGILSNCYYDEHLSFVNIQSKNFVLSDAINIAGKAFASAKISDEKNKSDLLEKIKNPNNFQGTVEFLKEFHLFIKSAGYVIIWKKYSSFGVFKTLELINVNPDTVIERSDKSISFVFQEKQEIIKKEDYLIFYDTHVLQNSIKGYSRNIPLRSQIENIEKSQIAKGTQITNSLTTIVSPKKSTGNNMDEGLNAPVPVIGGGLKTQKEELEGKLNFNLKNKIILSKVGLDATNLSEKSNNVKFSEIIETDLLAIYHAHGVPVELTPYGKNATFENKPVAEISLIEKEAEPLMRSLISGLNAEFSSKGTLNFSYDHLECMSVIHERTQKTNQTVIEQYGYLFEKELIDKNEFIKILQSKKILE